MYVPVLVGRCGITGDFPVHCFNFPLLCCEVHFNCIFQTCRLRLKCDGTHAETIFCLSVKQMSPFKSAGGSVQLTAGSRVVHIRGSNAGYAMFRGSVKSTVYPLHSPVSPSLPLPCVTMGHHISTGLYNSGIPQFFDLVLCLTLYMCVIF